MDDGFARRTMAAAVGATAIIIFWNWAAQAGGAIGWAAAADEFSAEGIAVGTAMTVLAIVAVGAILSFGITSILTTVIMVCLGGALMANAEAVAGIFGGGAGGGSILDTSFIRAA